MPNIINKRYFKHDLFIPNAVEQPAIGDNTPNKVADINDAITVIERDVLLNALGLTIYNELQAELPITENSPQKWIDLVNGVEYNGKVWEGLSAPKSLIAYAIYYQYLSDNSDFWSTLGVTKPDSANSTNVNPSYKISVAYQNYVKKYQSGYLYKPFKGFVNGVYYEDYYGKHEEVNVSLYQYLKDNADLYGWGTKFFKPDNNQVNSLGL